MNVNIIDSPGCSTKKELKHECVEQAIKRLGEVFYQLEGLKVRISGEDRSSDPEKPTANCTLQSLLVTAPDQIHRFCDMAMALIDDVEESLF